MATSGKARVKSGASNKAEEVPGEHPYLPFPVVVVGASAGGLKALTALLQSLPLDSGMAFVLVQHLEPSHDSALSHLLASATQMTVREVIEGMVVEANCVYVIPPNKRMTIRSGALRLTPRTEASASRHPIDDFASALAEEQRQAAIGVVLSGTGSDGTLGLKAIKAAGGITFAQDPKTAEWAAMPMSVITAGAADFILSPPNIAAELTHISRHPYVAKKAVEEPSGAALDKVSLTLFSAVGVDVRLYKASLIRRRVAHRMALRKTGSLDDYVGLLRREPREAEALADDIFIHVTGFFRDPEAFRALRAKVLAKLAARKTLSDPIRIWVAGCSTGEEVYSVAMLLLEELGDRAARTKIQIFGSDIRERGVEHARAGTYTEAALAGVSSKRLKRFFVDTGHDYQVSQALRELCVFARHDLSADPPFSHLDLVSCRNVLIHMGPVLQKRTLSVFQYALKPGGFLFLGKSESISQFADAFSPADRKHLIFVRKSAGDQEYGFHSAVWPRSTAFAPPHPQAAPIRVPNHTRSEVERILLERYSPPALSVDSDLRIVHFHGDTSRYLAPAAGHPSFHLLKILRPELVVDLRSALKQAQKSGTRVTKNAVFFEIGGNQASVNLEVWPLEKQNGIKRDFLVVFQPAEPAAGEAGDAEKGKLVRRAASGTVAVRSERELMAARDHLRELISEHETAEEEMKAANEEILSSNEELQSTNEELETAKEELQSSNEELIGLNEELRHRNAELDILGQDLNNLLTGIEVPVVLLDGELRIRRFTPLARKLFNLLASDVGRPFSDIASNLEITDWSELLSSVTQSAKMIHREVKDRNARWYSLRMLPYKDAATNRLGVLIVLFDVDSIKRALEEARIARDYSKAIVETVREGLLVLAADLTIRSANRSYCAMFHASPEAVEGRHFLEVHSGLWNVPGLQDLVERVFRENATIEAFTLDRELANFGRRQFVLNANFIKDPSAAPRALLAIEDRTEHLAALEGRQQAENLSKAVLNSLTADIAVLDEDGRIIAVNDAWLTAIRESASPLSGQVGTNYLAVCQKAAAAGMPDAQAALDGIRQVLRGEQREARLEYSYRQLSRRRWYLMMATLLEQTGGAVVAHLDISPRKYAEERLKESESTLNAILESASQAILSIKPSGEILFANVLTQSMFGYSRDELLGRPLHLLLPAEARSKHRKHERSFFSHPKTGPMGEGLDLQGLRKDGSQFPVEVSLSHIQTNEGRVAVAFVSDITHRKREEQEKRKTAERLSRLTRQLLSAQEEERARISRELHDDITQKLSVIGMEMSRISRDAVAPPVAERMREVQDKLLAVSEDLRVLSHEFHPGTLQHLGLATALESHCREISQHSGLSIHFSSRNVLTVIPDQLAVAFYRIAQEALRNVMRHSRATEASVILSRGSEAGEMYLKLAIIDNGRGFLMEEVRDSSGLGMLSIEERARLVHATLKISSILGEGTSVEVAAPLEVQP